jgi:membrane protease YdiL (CAAX protease family)
VTDRAPTGVPPSTGVASSTWWLPHRWLLSAALVGLAVGLLVVEEGLIGTSFLVGPVVGDWMLWIGAPLVSAVVGSILYRSVSGRSVWGQRRPRWSDLAWGAAFGGLVMLSDLILATVFDLVVSDPGAPVQAWLDEAMMATPLLVGLGVSLATPLGEEVVFRGPLLRGVEARWPRWVAVVISSLLFGLVHLENLDPEGWLHVIGATIAGVLFALALLRAGHLLAAVTAHVVVNGTYTIVGLVAAGTLVWTVGPAGDVPSVDLGVGDCASAAWWDGEAIDAASEVACDDTHDLEVASRGHLPGGPWGDDALEDAALASAADDACRDVFEAYVGSAWKTSSLDYVALLPDPDRWADGDRELICLVVPYDDEVLGEPARGSGR